MEDERKGIRLGVNGYSLRIIPNRDLTCHTGMVSYSITIKQQRKVNVMKFEIGMEVLIDGVWAVVEEVFDNGQNAIVVDADGQDFEVGLDNVDFLRP